MNTTGESWLPVSGYEGYYEVSNLGRVRGLERWVPWYGTMKRYPSRILRPGTITSGYYHVILHRDSKSESRLVHVMVAHAFIGTKPPGYDINHKDGIKKHNTVENLEYVTRRENSAHAVRMRLIVPKKLDEQKVREIRDRHYRGASLHQLGREYGVCPAMIHGIVHGKRWVHVL